MKKLLKFLTTIIIFSSLFFFIGCNTTPTSKQEEENTLTPETTNEIFTISSGFSSLLNQKSDQIKNSTAPLLGEYDLTFEEKDNILKAGDDNYFDLQLTAIGYSSQETIKESRPIYNNNINASITKIEQINSDGSFTEVNEIDILDQNLDLDKNHINFQSQAIGNVYKITVTPDASKIHIGRIINPVEIIVEVVDGYNVYNGKDLSVVQDHNNNEDWYNWRDNTPYYDIRQPNSIILQKDIKLTADDVPASFFYTEEEADKTGLGLDTKINPLTGSLKDRQSIYSYSFTKPTEVFTIYGNYFQIDTKSFPTVELKDGKMVSETQGIQSETSLFNFSKFSVFNNYEGVSVVDLSYSGNGARSSDYTNSGGLIFLRNSANTLINNVVSIDAYSLLHLQDLSLGMEEHELFFSSINNVKSYNSYHSHISTLRNSMIIEDCTFIDSGSPAIIVMNNYLLDYEDVREPLEQTAFGGYSNIDIINSEITSVLNGNEPWFTANPSLGSLVQLMLVYQESNLITKSQHTIATTIELENGNSIPAINIPVLFMPYEQDKDIMTINGILDIYESRTDYESDRSNSDDENYEKIAIGLDFNKDNNLSYLARSKKFNTGIDNYIFESTKTGEYNEITIPLDSSGTPYGEISASNKLDCTDTEYLNLYMPNGMGAVIKVVNK